MENYSISLAGSGTSVSCRSNQSVLDAMLRSGVWMPNSCNQGTCGTCKLRVQDGRVDHLATPLTTLPEQERTEGWVLACQASPRSDLVLEPASSVAPPGPVHRLRDVWTSITSVEDLALDIRRLVLAPDEPLDFTAGQHVEVTVPGTAEARLYSMANPPGGSSELEFHVRREPGGIASESWIFKDAAVGQRVHVQGPLGDLRWDDGDDDEGPVVLIAGGTGLAPLLSMLRAALPHAPQRHVTLYHGVRTRAHLYAKDELNRLHQQHPGFDWVGCADDDPNGRGTSVQAFLADHASARGYTGYLCGPPPMVEAGAQAFKRRRMAPRRIFRERFLPGTTSVPATGSAPVATVGV